jgi:hypothetical protein
MTSQDLAKEIDRYEEPDYMEIGLTVVKLEKLLKEAIDIKRDSEIHLFNFVSRWENANDHLKTCPDDKTAQESEQFAKDMKEKAAAFYNRSVTNMENVSKVLKKPFFRKLRRSLSL